MNTKFNLKFFVVLIIAFLSPLLMGEKLIDVVDEAEQYIARTYKGEMARRFAMDKLQKIVIDAQKTDKEKMDEIRREFLAPKKEEDEITEANAYHLIWTPPLSWDIHSIAIAYDVDRSRTYVISGETVDSRKKTRTEASENGTKSAVGSSVSGGVKTGLGYQTKVSMLGFLTARPQFEAEARGSHKTDWDESKTELWSKSRQEQLTRSFEELTKDIQSTQVKGCHLSFAIDFQNNSDEDLIFSASSTVPVYMGGTLVLEACPENIGNKKTFTIPRRATTTIKFRGEISTTQAYRLLEFMKTNAPTILPERGQLTIESDNGKVKNAITESRSVSHSVIRCGEYEWKVRSTWNDRRVTLREALWAVNALYEKAPFVFRGGLLVSVLGFPCGPSEDMDEADAYPVVEMDGQFFSRLGKSQLDNRLPDNGLRFHLNSLNGYIDSENYAYDFYGVLLKDLLAIGNKGENGEIQFLLGEMYYKRQGTSKDVVRAVEWYRKAAEQGNADAQLKLGFCYGTGEGIQKDMTKAVRWYRKAADQGKAGAQFNLALYYSNGYGGVQKDMAKAVEWYRKAAEQGIADAQCNLGVCYYYGNGVQKDRAKAVEWFRKAAEQGDAMAQCNLGKCYENGEGVQKDMVKAVEWWRKAAEQGYADAKKRLRELGY